MQIDKAAAPFDVRVEDGLLAIAQIACVPFVNQDDVGMFEVGSAGDVQSAIDDGPMVRQNLAPVGQKLRVVMLTLAVGLETAQINICIPLGFWPCGRGAPLGPVGPAPGCAQAYGCTAVARKNRNKTPSTRCRILAPGSLQPVPPAVLV